MKNTNIIIVGVGGQGILLASKVIGVLAVNSGLDVKVSEVHGMAQRGGSVITHVKIGHDLFTPMVAEGEADILVSLELLEAARSMHYLKDEGILISSNQKIDPVPVKIGLADYPTDPLQNFNKKNLVLVESSKLAIESGNKKCENTVLLGVLSKYLNFTLKQWNEAFKQSVKENTLETNLKAFELGRNSK